MWPLSSASFSSTWLQKGPRLNWSTLSSDFEILSTMNRRSQLQQKLCGGNKCWIFYHRNFSCSIPLAGIWIRKWREYLWRHGGRGWSEEDCGGESLHHGVYIYPLMHTLLPTRLSGSWTNENSSCPSRLDRAWNKEICAALLPAHRRQIKMQWGSRGEAHWEQQIRFFRCPLLTVLDTFTFTPNYTGRSEAAGMLVMFSVWILTIKTITSWMCFMNI